MKKIITIALFICFLSLIAASTGFAADKMTYEQFLALYKEWKDREAAALTAISIEDSLIKDLKERYKLTEAEIARIQQDIYDLLGVYEADMQNYNQEISNLENQLKTMRALTPELLYQRKDEIEAAEARMNQLKQESLANIPANWDKLENLTNDIEGLKKRVPKPRNDSYTVIKGDCLWKISGKPEIYNDVYKWPRIWSANAESIKDPNLIYPNQNLVIIRQIGPNQHLVTKGEHLKAIAEKEYGDPFAWTKIYEANKNQIEDQNLIYPEQILTLPGK